MAWHDNADNRKQIGDQLETVFAQTVLCPCGGRFKFIGDHRAGFPDFTCENCGQLVDVKSSPQAEATGNISVSAIPWKNYPDELLLITRIRGEWLGEFKKFIQIAEQAPRLPTHHGQHTIFKNTRWYLISWRKFRKLAILGFTVRKHAKVIDYRKAAA